jgi:hypothetical protein
MNILPIINQIINTHTQAASPNTVSFLIITKIIKYSAIGTVNIVSNSEDLDLLNTSDLNEGDMVYVISDEEVLYWNGVEWTPFVEAP